MGDFEVYAEVRFCCSLGYIQADTQEEAIEKAEKYYEKEKSDIDLWGQGTGEEVYEFTADSIEEREEREYITLETEPENAD